MGKKGGKKAKGPTYYVEDEHCIPFGFRANDIIKTPLGLTGTVIGVKYENPDDKATGRLWAGSIHRRVSSFRPHLQIHQNLRNRVLSTLTSLLGRHPL